MSEVLRSPAPIQDAPTQLHALHEDLQAERAARLQAEERLEMAGSRARALLDAALDAVVSLSAVGLIEEWNVRAETMFGWTRAQAIDRSLADLVIPQRAHHEYQRALERCLAAGAGTSLSRSVELPAQHRDGQEFRIELAIAPTPAEAPVSFHAFIRDVSERTAAAEALRASEQRYRRLVEGVRLVAWEFDRASRRFTFVSHHAEALLGYPLETWREPAFWYQHLHPEDRQRAQQFCHEQIQRGVDHELEYRMVHSDGSPVWIRDMTSLVWRDKQVVGLHGVFIDITDRKRVEESLHESEDRFRKLVETTTDWVWQIDENAVYTYAGPKVLEILGYSPREVMGRTPFDLMPPAETERLRSILGPIIAARQPFSLLRKVNRHKNGREVVLETSGLPVFDRQGAFRGYRGIDRDITERTRAERAMREMELRLGTVVNTAPIVVWAVDAAGIFTLSEGRGLAAWSLAPGQIVGQSVFDVYRDHPLICDSHRRALAGESVSQVVELGNNVFESRLAPLRDSAKRIVGCIGVAVDVTERTRAERSLRESEKRLSTIMENTPNVAIEGYDLDGRVLFWNKAAESLFGWREQEAVGKTLDQLMLDEASNRQFVATLQEIARTRTAVGPMEWEFTDRRGARGTCYSTVFAAPAAEGGQIFICMDIDITQRKQAEESLRRSESRYRALAETSTVGIWQVTPEGQTIYINPTMCSMLQVNAPSELAGVTFHSFMSESSRAVIRREHAKRAMGVGSSYEVELIGKRGRRLNVLISDAPVRAADGSLQSLIGTFIDITERKRTEATLQHSAELHRLMLNELDHRVRNNLASLSALIDISARDKGDVREFAAAIRGRVQAMASVHVLLTRGHWRNVGLHDLIVSMFPDDLRARVDVHGEPAQFPPSQSAALGMVVQELIANSLKYGSLSTPAGRVEVAWTIKPSDSTGGLEPGRCVELIWQESGGPPIEHEPAPKPGLGTELILGFVKAELRGKAELAYPRIGASHRFTLTLEKTPT